MVTCEGYTLFLCGLVSNVIRTLRNKFPYQLPASLKDHEFFKQTDDLVYLFTSTQCLAYMDI